MKKGSQFKGLLKELGRDPRLKQVIAKRRTRGKGEARVENMSGIVLLILAIAARFATKKESPGPRRADGYHLLAGSSQLGVKGKCL
jgi:hypothetical protein